VPRESRAARRKLIPAYKRRYDPFTRGGWRRRFVRVMAQPNNHVALHTVRNRTDAGRGNRTADLPMRCCSAERHPSYSHALFAA